MFLRIHAMLCRMIVLCLILMMQGPAVVTQEIAWVKMLVTYTQERGFKRGVIETFDGKHPCCLCNKAAEIRKSESQNNPTDRPIVVLKRLAWAEMIATASFVLPHARSREIHLNAPVALGDIQGKIRDAPDSPPPESRVFTHLNDRII